MVTVKQGTEAVQPEEGCLQLQRSLQSQIHPGDICSLLLLAISPLKITRICQ